MQGRRERNHGSWSVRWALWLIPVAILLPGQSFGAGRAIAFDPDATHGFNAGSVDLQYKPLGSEKDCTLRTSEAKYCADVFAAISSIDSYWKANFVKIAPSGQRVTYAPPKELRYVIVSAQASQIDCSDEKTPTDLCGDILYSDKLSAVTFNERRSIDFFKSDGGFALMSRMAMIWGLHLQNLLAAVDQGASERTYGVGSMLAAGCFAGVWMGSYVDQGKATSDELDLAYNGFFNSGVSGGASNVDVYGTSQHHVLAVRTGYYWDEPEFCLDWSSDYDNDPLIEYSQYLLALSPTMTTETRQSQGLVRGAGDYIYYGKTEIVASGWSSLQPPASAGLEGLLRQDYFKASVSMRLLDPVDLNNLPRPDRGNVSAAVFLKSTSYARRFEITGDAKSAVHGIAYLHQRDSDRGILLVATRDGPQSSQDWRQMEETLSQLLLGLSLK